MTTARLLLLLFVGRLVATCLSLGSGASGGIFSPSLFMGATLRGAVGVVGAAPLPAGRASTSTARSPGGGVRSSGSRITSTHEPV